MDKTTGLLIVGGLFAVLVPLIGWGFWKMVQGMKAVDERTAALAGKLGLSPHPAPDVLAGEGLEVEVGSDNPHIRVTETYSQPRVTHGDGSLSICAAAVFSWSGSASTNSTARHTLAVLRASQGFDAYFVVQPDGPVIAKRDVPDALAQAADAAAADAPLSHNVVVAAGRGVVILHLLPFPYGTETADDLETLIDFARSLYKRIG